MLKPVCAGFLGGICSVFSGAFDVFWWLCCWKLQLNLSGDFSKNHARAPFEKTSLNQQQRKEVVVVAVAATQLPALVATINIYKINLQCRKTAKLHNDNANTVKNATPTF